MTVIIFKYIVISIILYIISIQFWRFINACIHGTLYSDIHSIHLTSSSIIWNGWQVIDTVSETTVSWWLQLPRHVRNRHIKGFSVVMATLLGQVNKGQKISGGCVNTLCLFVFACSHSAWSALHSCSEDIAVTHLFRQTVENDISKCHGTDAFEPTLKKQNITLHIDLRVVHLEMTPSLMVHIVAQHFKNERLTLGCTKL